MAIKQIELSKIRTDGDTQPRAALDQAVVDLYAEDLANGADFPPAIVFHDGSDFWLADGFHRYFAHAQAKRETIAAEVRKGTKRDAQWYSFGANKSHGLRRNGGDATRAIRCILSDREWRSTPQNQIASHVGVSPALVSQVKTSIKDLIDRPPQLEVTRNGKTYAMNTTAIGGRQRLDHSTAQDAPDDSGTNVATLTEAEILTEANRIKEQRSQERTEKIHAKQAEKANELIWPEDEASLRKKLDAGQAVAINLDRQPRITAYAREHGLLVIVDRSSEWGNPFFLPADGSRDEVCEAYEHHYLPHKKSLLAKLGTLKGKALGCHCSPERCHGDCLAKLAHENRNN